MSFFEFMADDCECPRHFYTRPRQPEQKSKKCPTKTEVLNVTLEDLYKGKELKFKVTRNVTCKDCKGNGSEKIPAMKCVTCHGRGKYVAKRPKSNDHKKKKNTFLKDCTKCGGKGKTEAFVLNCTTCNKARNVRESVFFNVNITPGMRDGQLITLSGEGDEMNGLEAGDIVFCLQCKKHDRFERNGDDLIMEKKIGLSEALCGTSMLIKQLDGRNLLLKREQYGIIIQSGNIYKIKNEGMPLPNNNKKFGNMFIKFEVVFPSSYFFKDDNLYKELEEALPPKPKVEPHGEEVSLQEFDKSRYQFTNRREAYDSDNDTEEEERRQFSHPQCPMH
uniref:CR-type domain-containing protein n=1 Tax=Panagrolaimus sp. PS1159 TaxID=55785 RepID=A0AC35GW94_9BILA